MIKKEAPIIVCCICKNESSYIREFVSYHLNGIGFDKVIIGDNNDAGGETYDEILSDFIKNGEVEIINLRGQQGVQIPFYNWILENYDFSWCAFIDCDEFITFGKDFRFLTIKDFLKIGEVNDVKGFKMNWMCYGDNERILRGNGDVIERFPKPMPLDFKFSHSFPENYHVKSILKKECGGHFINQPHTAQCSDYYLPIMLKVDDSPFNDRMTHDTLYIRHYYNYTKSLGEWINKKINYH